MRSICLYFQVHQPFRFKRYRFFEIGVDHYYYDDYNNERIMRKVAENCYLPANKILLDLIKEYGSKFKVTFSITGIALDQFELYAPEVLESFRKLAETGSVEFLAETYSHSLASLKSKEEFQKQVTAHSQKIEQYFGQKPKVFRNTELIYSDNIGNDVQEMGFEGIITEGAKHILGWKSPNFLYCNAINPRLKVLLKNYRLSDDIAFRFCDKGWEGYPVTAKKYAGWLNKIDKKEEIINLFMDYETFGEHQHADTGIFGFLENLPKEIFKHTNYQFVTPSEAIENLQPVSAVNVPYPISWADEERDLTAWLGNDLQNEAFNKLYQLKEKVEQVNDPKLLTDWKYLQVSDHLYYMSTKIMSDGDVHSYFNPFQSPYDAFINYMNILSDFEIRLNAAVPQNESDERIRNLTSILKEKDEQLEKYLLELKKLKASKSKTSSKSTAVTKPKTATGKAGKPASKTKAAKTTTKSKVTKTTAKAKAATSKSATKTKSK